MITYDESNTWKSAFEGSAHKQKKYQLESCLRQVRNHASQLGDKIRTDFPNLTIHDVTHMDALWEMADLLIDEKHKLNPFEIFILGCTFYIHDSALCFEAFKDGRRGVRETNQWKDCYARMVADGTQDEAAKEAADFKAVRDLHAQQAETLATLGWTTNEGKTVQLIECDTLRRHTSELIGKVAASHHWSIEELETKLENEINVVYLYPSDWKIRPRLLACILRCADAAQIDGTRAPDALLEALDVGGVSLKHWQGQNRIGSVTKYKTTSELLITSTASFPKNEADSWWVVYETVQMIERELRRSNALLADCYGDDYRLAAESVRGSSSPECLAKQIKAVGWTPMRVEVKVSNVEKIIKKFGGRELYQVKDMLSIVIRELLQNATDAVTARKKLSPSFDSNSEILVELIPPSEESSWALRVADMGVGMSKNVLTNTLLDFGNSFWASEKVAYEHPGLQSKNPNLIGQYGIGFFSVFEIAKKVSIYSRRCKEGEDMFRRLEFPKGFSLHPIYSEEAPDNSLRGYSTVVEIELSKDCYDRDGVFEIHTNIAGVPKINLPFTTYVSSLLSNVRAEIVVRHGCDTEILSPLREFNETSATAVLSRISFGHKNKCSPELLSHYLTSMRPIRDEKHLYGYAALPVNTEREVSKFLSVKSIGGLCSHEGRSQDKFIGWMDYHSCSAKREPRDLAIPKPLLEDWLDEQIEILNNSKLTDQMRLQAAGWLSTYGRNPLLLRPKIPLRHQGIIRLCDAQKIQEIVKHNQLVVTFNERLKGLGNLDNNINYTSFDFSLDRTCDESGLLSGVEFVDNKNIVERSFVALITAYAEESGEALEWTPEKGTNDRHGFFELTFRATF